MSENLYIMTTTATPTTGVPAGVTTGTSATVLIQLAVPTTRQIALIEYGVSFSGAPAAAALSLRSTNASCTFTNMTAGTILPYSNVNAPASLLTAGSTGWVTAGGTNAVAPNGTVNQIYDSQLLTTNTYIKQFPLAREPMVGVSGTAEWLQLCIQVPTTSVNALGYIIWRE
jgi:hypothetical protein